MNVLGAVQIPELLRAARLLPAEIAALLFMAPGEVFELAFRVVSLALNESYLGQVSPAHRWPAIINIEAEAPVELLHFRWDRRAASASAAAGFVLQGCEDRVLRGPDGTVGFNASRYRIVMGGESTGVLGHVKIPEFLLGVSLPPAEIAALLLVAASELIEFAFRVISLALTMGCFCEPCFEL